MMIGQRAKFSFLLRKYELVRGGRCHGRLNHCRMIHPSNWPMMFPRGGGGGRVGRNEEWTDPNRNGAAVCLHRGSHHHGLSDTLQQQHQQHQHQRHQKRRYAKSTFTDKHVASQINNPSPLHVTSKSFGPVLTDDIATAIHDDGYQWPSIYDETHDMMMAAYISYPLSFLIREAKKGNLKNSADVLAKLQTIRDGDSSTALHPHEVIEIVDDNKEYIARHPQNNLKDKFGWYSILEYWNNISVQHPGSISLLEFDDHDDAHRLVYGILINRVMKRITVIFRGTYADGTDDWKRNLQFDQVEIPVPYNLQPILMRREREESTTDNHLLSSVSDNSGDGIGKHHNGVPTMRIHQGLYEYLFDNTERCPKYQQERYEEILSHLRWIIQENPGFKIYVAGHSLGGALAKFFAFYLSTSRQALQIPKPVTCICFGSLVMGDAGFQRAFHSVERLGWIRHLRVTNEGDPVCYLPPLQDYQPSGMHLRLRRRQGHVLWHPSSRGGQDFKNDNSWSSLMGVLRSSIVQGTDLFQQHLVPAYLRRLEREKGSLRKLTLNDLYRDHELVGTDDYSNRF